MQSICRRLAITTTHAVELEEFTPPAGDTDPIRRFRLSNHQGTSVAVMEQGAALLSVYLTTAAGQPMQVNRGLPTVADYLVNTPYMGATCGRHAGRIAYGRFVAAGTAAQLSRNDGKHHLHGGEAGFSHKRWRATALAMNSTNQAGVRFSYVSAHLEEGYPGELACEVTYRLDAQSRLTLDYRAEVSTQPTLVNLTNHTYWNLGEQDHIGQHQLELSARSVLEFDAHSIPTGRRVPVQGTSLDFTSPAMLGERLRMLARQMPGFDHCYVDLPATGGNVRPVARLQDTVSGNRMVVFSDQPAVVFYTGNYLDGSAAAGGHQQHAALCLECQGYSDAPNHAEFPSPVLNPGEVYTQRTIYQFFPG
ncbi:MAG: aldose epimerase family protein [Pseudomonadales bacterium]